MSLNGQDKTRLKRPKLDIKSQVKSFEAKDTAKSMILKSKTKTEF